MRTSLRLFAAALSTLLAAAFLIAVPFVSPAHAITGFNKVNIGSGSIVEGNTAASGGDITFPITLTPTGALDTISATVTTQDLTAFSGNAVPDYTAKTQTFTWSFNEGGTKNFTVHVNGDTTPEPDEQFRVVFAQPPSGADAGTTGTGTITNDDQNVGTVPQISVSGGGSQLEGNVDNVRNITVHLDKIYDQDVSVNYATLDGTAKAPGDYTAITTQKHTWPANTPPADFVIPVTIKGDTFGEPDESFQVVFGSNNNAAFAGNPNQTITLRNDDAGVPVVSVDAITPIVEGDSGTKAMHVTVSVTPAPQQPISVNYFTTDGSAIASTQDAKGDYVAIPKTNLTIGTGQTSGAFDVTINGDVAQEPDEQFTVSIADPNNANIGTAAQQGTILNDDFGQITTGPGAGGGPDVETFGAAGAHLAGFYAYEAAFRGGVHVARGDFFKADGSVGADGIDEIVTAPGKNSRPLVRVFALDGTIRASFFAYDQNFAGGVYLAAGNFDGDASNGDELVVAAGPGGGPHVKVLKIKGPGDNIVDISNGGFYAYDPGFHGGVHLAAANLSGDARDEIITGAGPGGGPHVRVFGLNGNNAWAPTGGFFAYAPTFTGGVFVAATAGKIVTGAGPGGGPHVRVFSGPNGSPDGPGFFAYGAEFHGGVSVAMGNLDNDPAAEIVTGPGAGGGPHIRAFKQDGSLPFGGGFFAYQNFSGGVEVSIGNGGA